MRNELEPLVIITNTPLQPSKPVADHPERGASLVEYALLVVLIAVVCLLAVQLLGDQASTSFSKTASGLTVGG